ncbi:uncharacterized protein PV09_09771, partial [Verruconis gallopava]
YNVRKSKDTVMATLLRDSRVAEYDVLIHVDNTSPSEGYLPPLLPDRRRWGRPSTGVLLCQ